MLDQTDDRLNRLSPELRQVAEAVALAVMTAELKEDFLSPDRASRTADEHRVENTDDWRRAVNAAVSSLLALHELGYTLQR